MTDAERLACLDALTGVAKLNGEPTPPEFEAFLDALHHFHPLPSGVTPESLLGTTPDISGALPKIQSPAYQQQVYRSAYAILRSKGIQPDEAAVLRQMESVFQLSPEVIAALTKQARASTPVEPTINSTLIGMSSLIRREGEVRRLIFDYALGAAIVGLIPISGGGSLEMKLLAVLLLMLKMVRDIRNLWGRPTGQGVLAVIGNVLGTIGAIVAGLLVWGTVFGLGVVMPYVGAFDLSAGFATATWMVGQSTHQFYTSTQRPDINALKRAFPDLIPSDP